jgi:LacI family transcriptional regulator, galactose operon repressor
MRKTSIKELATKANVSVTTVSRVFNGHPHTNAKTAKLVKKLAREINYIPKSAARQYRVAVIISKLDENQINNYTSTLLMEIGNYCSEKSIHFQIIPENCLNLLDEYYIDYAISLVSNLSNIKQYSRTKFIFINTIPDGGSGVRSDNFESISHAVEYLVGHGRKRLAIVLPKNSTVERITAFQLALDKVGLAQEKCVVIELFGQQEFEIFSKHIRHSNVDGLIIGGESMPMQICYFLDLLKLKVPDDISVISYEVPNFSKFLLPPHTTIKQNFKALVEEAFAMLKDTKKVKTDNNVIIPCEFIERESV